VQGPAGQAQKWVNMTLKYIFVMSVSPLPGDQNRGETHARNKRSTASDAADSTPEQTEVGTPLRAAEGG